MFENLKKNIIREKEIVANIRVIESAMKSDSTNKEFYKKSIDSLISQIKFLNRAIPDLLKESSPILKKVKSQSLSNKEVVNLSYVSPMTKEKKYISLKKEDKKLFLENLKMSEDIIKGIRKINSTVLVNQTDRASLYASFSNKYFREYSERLIPNFPNLSTALKKGNIKFLILTYISMALMSTVLFFFLGVFLFVSLLIFSLSNWIYFWIPLFLPLLSLGLFYLYPIGEASTIQKKITQELPFATIQMSAIAGSDIEPTRIFKIIAMSKEYPAIGGEIKKLLAQVEIYGYDLVTSLKNVASKTSNKKLAELFSGLATNINSGGELKNYLEKKSENFLLDYKLERQKYSDLAGTFMDIYISILIAAPLVLMMMFIVMNVSGLGVAGLGIVPLLMISIAVIIFVNIVFLLVLNLKQPKI